MKAVPEVTSNCRESLFDASTIDAAIKAGSPLITELKKLLAQASETLHEQFRADAPIGDIIRGRAKFIDQVLRYIWQQMNWPDNKISLVAVGGYGRGELHPFSDIDLLILLDGAGDEPYRTAIEQFLTLLWDIGLEVGHSVRTLAECQAKAKEDITIASALMESRTLCGDETSRAKMMELVGPDRIWPSASFFSAKRKEQADRHSRYDYTDYRLEPNIKSCPGGLRDIQTIGWIAKRHFRVSRLNQLIEQGFLTEQEYELLEEGRNLLWKIRYGLHMLAGRCEDRLSFEYQKSLADLFGYTDTKESLAVEQFMKNYYRCAATLVGMNELLIQVFDEEILKADEQDTVRRIDPRFNARNNFLEAASDNIFEKTPYALMEIFVLLARHEDLEGIRSSTIRLIFQNRDLVDDDFRQHPRNRRLFIELLRSEHLVAKQLRRMNRYGLLGRYLPEFGKIVGQTQHDLFHVYTVDAHTLLVIKNMRRFFYPEAKEKFPVASYTVRRLPRIELLYVAGLYHDIAKGRGGDHSTLGAVDALAFCKRHGFNKRESNLVAWLVENHLYMSAVAQRKDISDPEVIREFAIHVQDQVHLDYLYALTVADINATNPTLWNSWRASLFHQLYLETKKALRRGLENPVRKRQRIAETRRSALRRLQNKGYGKEQVLAIWNNPGDDYFLRESPADIVWHTEAIAKHEDTDKPLILIRDVGGEFNGITQVFIYAQNREYLFALIASVMEKLDLNIQGARIFTTENDYTIDSFFVLDNNGKSFADRPQLVKQLERTLTTQLERGKKFLAVADKRVPRQLKHFTTPTRTHLFDDHEHGHTVLEITTPDRPGLLARIGRLFIDFGVILKNARITTLGEQVEDIFFITNKDSQPLNDNALAEALQKKICEELDNQAATSA
jgi:[protein-PII] uridylyltransferase